MNRLPISIFQLSRETMSGTIFFLLIVGVLHMSTTNYELELVNAVASWTLNTLLLVF